jgi:hypothetical protein
MINEKLFIEILTSLGIGVFDAEGNSGNIYIYEVGENIEFGEFDYNLTIKKIGGLKPSVKFGVSTGIYNITLTSYDYQLGMTEYEKIIRTLMGKEYETEDVYIEGIYPSGDYYCYNRTDNGIFFITCDFVITATTKTI